MKKITLGTMASTTWRPQQAPAFPVESLRVERRHGATEKNRPRSSMAEARGFMPPLHNHFGRTPRRRAGFAVFTAVVLIGLTGIAIAALAALFTTHAHRTQAGQTNAQLRQLLLAAIHAPPPVPGSPNTIALPSELSAQDATLSMQTVSNDGPILTVQAVARLGKHKAAQTLIYRQQSGQWKLAEARLFQ